MARMGEKLAGLRILIAEDSYLLASILADCIVLYGGTVVGPVQSQSSALALCKDGAVDCAVLDVKLDDGPCYPLIASLTQQGVPVLLTTGYKQAHIPALFQALPIFIKPFDLEALANCIAYCCRAKLSGRSGL